MMRVLVPVFPELPGHSIDKPTVHDCSIKRIVADPYIDFTQLNSTLHIKNNKVGLGRPCHKGE
jgi:hypothetical protein